MARPPPFRPDPRGGLSERMARVLLSEWATQGWLTVSEPSRKKRSYELSAVYRQVIGNPGASG